MKRMTVILTATIILYGLPVYSADLEYSRESRNEDMALVLKQGSSEPLRGTLVHADQTNFLFHNNEEVSYKVIPRTRVKYLETNLGVNLLSIFKEKSAESLVDVIELNDGTMIDCIILDLGADEIQYFSGDSLSREIMHSSSVYMVHMDGNSVQIPYPVLRSEALLQ